MEKQLSKEAYQQILSMQINEMTEHEIYKNIASFVKEPANKQVLSSISEDELVHAGVWEKYTGKKASPKRFRVFWFTLLARVLGYTFAIKLMEDGEGEAQNIYEKLSAEAPEAARIKLDEERHESALIDLLDEERLQYVGSMVLGLSDALVELTGTIAGITFALANTKLVALSGLITGISATLSMASSEYLSAKSEGRSDALKSCTYTGVAYCITVILMILPYLLLPAESYGLALGIMIAIVIAEIALFSYYISVAKGQKFHTRFFEMAGISMSVAVIAFVIGLLAKRFLGIDI